MSFSKIILDWYVENKRSLPWRQTRDPYRIWLSEIMLQQTRVSQGLPYYHKFLKHFPTVEDLARAPEEKILKLWQGLGYYSRARNLHTTAKIVTDKYGGNFPKSYKELLKLKGVGDYTASAIASICFDEPEPVVDGNVYRVLSRYFGIDLPINSTKGVAHFKQLAREVMDAERIRDYNQAIMEFGAMQCTPKNPGCSLCPLSESCVALEKNSVHTLPVKLKKRKAKNRFFNYLVPISITDKGSKTTLLEQRRGRGIWQNLWQFPLLESENEIDETAVRQSMRQKLNIEGDIYLYNERTIVHKLSHQHLYTRFWILETKDNLKGGVPLSKLEKYAVPVLIADFLKTFKNSYFCAS